MEREEIKQLVAKYDEYVRDVNIVAENTLTFSQWLDTQDFPQQSTLGLSDEDRYITEIAEELMQECSKITLVWQAKCALIAVNLAIQVCPKAYDTISNPDYTKLISVREILLAKL